MIDSSSKFNAISPAYAKKLGLQIRKTDVSAQKIDGSTLSTFEIVIVVFQVQDKLGRARFFQKTFLMANTSMEVVFEMPFLTLSNANVGFLDKKLTWRTYSVGEILPTTKRVQIIDWKEFAKAALDPKNKAFVLHIVTITLKMTIYPEHKAQIDLLKAKKAPVLVPAEYLDFAKVFSEELTVVLPEHTKININSINLEEGKQPSYGLIYSSELVELETLKIYIETYLKTEFI